MPFLGLLYKQPDRGTMILFGMVTVVVLLLSGMRKRYAIIPTLLGAGLAFHFYNSSKMVRDRMDAFLHPEFFPQTTGSQALKSLAALREGGLEGVGLGSGVIKLTIPEQHTDFILPVIGEELGLSSRWACSSPLSSSCSARRGSPHGQQTSKDDYWPAESVSSSPARR